MARFDPQFKLRLPGELKERLERAATAERRSLNSQIIILIEKALGKDTAETAATVSAE